MRIIDVFQFAGRAVFVGEITGDAQYIQSALTEVWVDNEKKSVPFRIEGEMLSDGATAIGERGGMRSISTVEPRCLDHEAVSHGLWELRTATTFLGTEDQTQLSISMHRHLLGLESLPSDYAPDPLSQGSMFPEGWDGDARVSFEPDGYLLRAWNAGTSLAASGRGRTYKAARECLLDDVRKGRRVITVVAEEAARN